MATPKTPVSILNEYMFRAKKIPQFDLIRSMPGPEPLFEFEVSVDHVKVTGCGRNKKDAKHAAARNALAELAKTDHVIREQLITNYGPPAQQPTSSKADDCYSSLVADPRNTEQVTENAVGSLTTLCVEDGFPPPEYDLVHESGPPHCKNFVIHCVIKNLPFVGIGQSGTKKQAKQISAKRMIEKIKGYTEKPICNVKEINFGDKNQKHSASISEAKRIYSSIKKNEGGMKCRESTNLVIASCHMNLQDLEGTVATALKHKETSGNPENILLRFAEEQNISYSVEFTKTIKDKDDHKQNCICIASLNTLPELSQFGVGPDESSARELAAYNLLRCLITMLD